MIQMVGGLLEMTKAHMEMTKAHMEITKEQSQGMNNPMAMSAPSKSPAHFICPVGDSDGESRVTRMGVPV